MNDIATPYFTTPKDSLDIEHPSIKIKDILELSFISGIYCCRLGDKAMVLLNPPKDEKESFSLKNQNDKEFQESLIQEEDETHPFHLIDNALAHMKHRNQDQTLLLW